MAFKHSNKRGGCSQGTQAVQKSVSPGSLLFAIYMGTFPALLRAAADNDVTGIVRLLEAGDDPNLGNAIGQTSLHLSSMHGHTEIVKVLLAAGANPNVTNQFGVTPLHYSAEAKANGLGTAKLLIEYGANKRAKANNGARPADRASGELLLLLDDNAENPLHQAITNLDALTLRTALDDDAGLSEQDARGQTPFHLAAAAAVTITGVQAKAEAEDVQSLDSLWALKLLLSEAEARDTTISRGACNKLDDKGLSPLHILVQASHMPCSAPLAAMCRPHSLCLPPPSLLARFPTPACVHSQRHAQSTARRPHGRPFVL